MRKKPHVFYGALLMFLFILSNNNLLAKSSYFFKGDQIIAVNKTLTLDKISGAKSFWKGEDGNYYDIEAAKHKGVSPTKYILTEVLLNKDGTAIEQRKGSFIIGDEVPPPPQSVEPQQVALLQIIQGGKLMPREKFTGKGIEIGLSYYIVGDSGIFNNKQFILDHFMNGEGIWKSDDGKYYKIGADELAGSEYYVIEVEH